MVSEELPCLQVMSGISREMLANANIVQSKIKMHLETKNLFRQKLAILQKSAGSEPETAAHSAVWTV